jgi:hypothetical protein
MQGTAGLVATGALLGLLATTSPSGAEEEFAVDLRAAQTAAQTEPLKSYVEGLFNETFFARFSTWINECQLRVGEFTGDFDLLITVGTKGNVEALRFEPKSPQAECFAARLKAEVLPVPPKANAVVPAGIRLNKK